LTYGNSINTLHSIDRKFRSKPYSFIGKTIKRLLVLILVLFFQFLKLSLPHVGLTMLCFVYCFLGAAVFIRIEAPKFKEAQSRRAQLIHDHQTLFWQKLAEAKRSSEANYSAYVQAANGHFLNFARNLHQVHRTIKIRPAENAELEQQQQEETWTFPSALFFVFSTLVTIG